MSMQTEAFNRRFADSYKATLPNLEEIQSKKLLITFCGVPGSGKTVLAKKLSKDLNAYRVNNDDIRDLLRLKGQSLEGVVIGQISRKVVGDILTESSNKTIVVDSSIDRSWPQFFETAANAQAATFVIRMNCSREEITKRLIARGKDSGYMKRHEIFFTQFEACKRNVAADMELEPDYSYREVLGRIKQKLATLK
jgi:predicted kinase